MGFDDCFQLSEQYMKFQKIAKKGLIAQKIGKD